MNSNSHGCETCSKICEDAKNSVKSLQKKVYTLTIVCTSALTLLGEQGAKAVLSTVNSMNSVMAAVDGKSGKDGKDPKDAKAPDKPAVGHVMGRPWNFVAPKNHEEVNFKNTDLLAMSKKPAKKEEKAELKAPELPQVVIDNVLSNNLNLTPLEIPNVNTSNSSDPFAVFLTPSTLPFDVYSTTIGLGNNYGFGGYYGMGSINSNPAPVPDAGVVSLFAVSNLFNNRKRS